MAVKMLINPAFFYLKTETAYGKFGKGEIAERREKLLEILVAQIGAVKTQQNIAKTYVKRRMPKSEYLTFNLCIHLISYCEKQK